MPESHYHNFFYPLQDRILTIVAAEKTGFYLTGGTALSRFYLNHRYSDDLDFFINNSPDFKLLSNRIIGRLKQETFRLSAGTVSKNFVRFIIEEENVSVKVDLVNDVSFHYGKFKADKRFGRIDNWRNILSNKLSALSRLEAKDVVDILFIAERYPFSWEAIVGEAKEKDLWVNPLEISKLIGEFPMNRLSDIKWIAGPDSQKAAYGLQIIQKEVLLGVHNSLCG
ncbi:MAG: hypothetical protein C4522_08090 [Desulfobacteraceae bacterium]|nr:MAG: hypothetical protein C4522_08090 [Desulfobacteraceae bacterium]